MPIQILLVDDDPRFSTFLAKYLSHAGFAVTPAANGGAALALVASQRFDLIVLDIMMPGMDGLEVLHKLRRATTLPAILLTAKGDELDRVRGLERGADDYVTKPCSPRELVARIHTVLRRTGPMHAERWVCGGITVDATARTVERDGVRVALTATELDLLVALVRQAGRVVRREELRDLAGRGDVAVVKRTIDVHIHNLRRKLGLRPLDTPRIDTVRGVGYVLVLGLELGTS